MQLYTMLAICLFILSVTGGLSPFRLVLGARRFHGAYLALCILALSQFQIVPTPEMRFNLCVIALPLILALWGRKENVRIGTFTTIALFALAAFGADKAGIFSGAGNGLLTGFIAGASAVALVDRPRTALASAVFIPVVCALLSSCYTLAIGDYAVLDLSRPALLDAQLCALCFGGVLLCMYAAAKAGERGQA